LSQGCMEVPSRNDAKDYKMLNVFFSPLIFRPTSLKSTKQSLFPGTKKKVALSVLGFSRETIVEVYSILSATLLLGNVEFDSEVNQVTGIDTISVRRPTSDDGLALVPLFIVFFSSDFGSYFYSSVEGFPALAAQRRRSRYVTHL
jgi:hypothetical protein